ncbi:glycosyltransferase family 4 protein [Patulibacter defluvii]|uniref:glycosyltransferase family 4 protein n=1 Tax=Patulibacter defluvii TaxID=3095358 RepID=UPI002A75D836|nr:glycosyltransferase family 4 protein [Patulibacter sp. DM4]
MPLLDDRTAPAVPTLPDARRLRVLAVIDHLVGGGAERAAVELALRLAERHEVAIAASRMGRGPASDAVAEAVEELRRGGVRVLALGRTRTRRVGEWRPLLGAMRRNGCDVVHTHMVGSNFWGPWLRGGGGAGAWVAHEHSGFARGDEGRAEALVNPWIVGRFADRVIVPSRWSAREMAAHHGVPAARMRVVPNGAPPAAADGDGRRDAVRAELGVAAGDPLIVVVAMLRPEKGQEVAVRALARLRRHHPTAVLALAGAGTVQDPAGTRPALERLAAEAGVGDGVRFLGRRGDVDDLLAAADVALLPSQVENLPLALVEYMRSGTPIVTTDPGGVGELVDDGEHALVVPCGDDQAMAAALRRAIDDPAAAAARARAARERFAARFTWDAIVPQVEAVYREALAARAGGRRGG